VKKLFTRIRRTLRQWWECRAKQCTYFKHYLAYGPADLTHEGYHAAEEKCGYWQKRDMDWMNSHPNAWDSPYRSQCEHWEKVVRA
jgi:hypothetical protein